MTSENTPESLTERTERPEQPTGGQRRRRASDSQEQRALPPPPRMRELPAYYGKDIQEAQDFLSGAKRQFRLTSPVTICLWILATFSGLVKTKSTTLIKLY
jgi:hypothetical protein